jgi:hypothetical protein
VRVRLLVAFAVALTALASPASAAEQKRYAVKGERVSVAVPDSWVTFTGDRLLDNATLEQLARDNPRLAEFVRAFTRSGGGVKFVALDTRLRGGFAANLNVVAVRVPGMSSFEQYRTALLAELRAFVPGRVSSSVVRIDGQQAVRLSYRLKLAAAGRPVTTQVLQYGFLRRGKSLVFTYSTLPRYAGAYAQAFRASSASIRFS